MYRVTTNKLLFCWTELRNLRKHEWAACSLGEHTTLFRSFHWSWFLQYFHKILMICKIMWMKFLSGVVNKSVMWMAGGRLWHELHRQQIKHTVYQSLLGGESSTDECCCGICFTSHWWLKAEFTYPSLSLLNLNAPIKGNFLKLMSNQSTASKIHRTTCMTGSFF